MSIEKDEQGKPMDIECHEYSTDERSGEYHADYKWIRIPDRWSYDLLSALKCMRKHPHETGMDVGFVDDVGRRYEDNDEMQKFFKHVQQEHHETLAERNPSFPKNGVLNLDVTSGKITTSNANEFKISYSIVMDKDYHLADQGASQHVDPNYPKVTLLTGYAVIYVPNVMLDADNAKPKLDQLFSRFKSKLGNGQALNGKLRISFEFLNEVPVKGLTYFVGGNHLIRKEEKINVSNFNAEEIFRKCYKQFAKRMEDIQ